MRTMAELAQHAERKLARFWRDLIASGGEAVVVVVIAGFLMWLVLLAGSVVIEWR